MDEMRLKVICSKPQQKLQDMDPYLCCSMLGDAKDVALDFTDKVEEEEDGLNSFMLPDAFYHHPDVERLELRGCFLDVKGLTNFPLLRHLTIGEIHLRPRSVHDLTANLYNLHSLKLTQCRFLYDDEDEADKVLKFESSSLMTLILDRNLLGQDPFFVLCVPQLQNFVFWGMVAPFVSVSNLNNLIEAEIDFTGETSVSIDTAMHLPFLLACFTKTPKLTVCSHTLRLIVKRPLIGQFNVKELTLRSTVHPSEFQGISMFLAHCPLLETLKLEISGVVPIQTEPETVDSRTFWRGEPVHPCLTNSLTTVVVKGFRGKEHELRFLKYILESSALPRQLQLHLSRDRAQRVQSFSRRSNDWIFSIE